jgi:hypothetical protein
MYGLMGMYGTVAIMTALAAMPLLMQADHIQEVLNHFPKNQ